MQRTLAVNLVASLVALLTLNSRGLGQVELDRFFPVAVQSGQSVAIKADGKFPQWPVKIECDAAGVTLACGEKQGEFQATVGADASGIAWVRLHDDNSASALTPLLIEPHAVQIESDANDSLAKATAVTLPVVAVGKFEKNGDSDLWKISLKKGEQMVASMIAQQLLRSPLDGVLQCVNARGQLLAQAEDSMGLDPQLVFVAKEDGDYYLRAFCFPETPNSTIGFAGGANFVYAIRITTGPVLDHVLPLHACEEKLLASVGGRYRAFGWNLPADASVELTRSQLNTTGLAHVRGAMGWQRLEPWPASTLASVPADGWSIAIEPDAVANGDEQPAMNVPLVYYGHIANKREVDRVRVHAKAGVEYRVNVVARRLSFKLDSVVRVIGADGKRIARGDDTGQNNADSTVDFKVDQECDVTIEVSDLADSSGPRHAYALQVTEKRPAVRLTVTEDRVRLLQGKSVEVPVTIERRDGYSERLMWSAKNLPTGVTFEAADSEAKGDSSKAVKVKLTAAADAQVFQGYIELSAVPVDENRQPKGDSQAVQVELRPNWMLDRVWLSLGAEKP